MNCKKSDEIIEWLNAEIKFAKSDLELFKEQTYSKHTQNYMTGFIDGLNRAKFKIEHPEYPIGGQ